MNSKKILLINPPIYDFAAYDFWMKPLGLLYLSSIFKEHGHNISLIDASDRMDSYFDEVKSDKFGRGKLFCREVEKPDTLKDIPRKYKRYGLPGEEIKRRILDFDPDFILVTCTMTYWYPGVIEISDIVRNIDIEVILLLGGIYPTLLPEHAGKLDYDGVYDLNDRYIEELEIEIPGDFSDFPAPDYSLYDSVEYAAIATSLGCPFKCPYCSAPVIYSGKQEKDVYVVVKEIEELYHQGIRKFALYDDALLTDKERFVELCEKILNRGINALFFTPNGLHTGYIDRKVAEYMKKTGFREPRLSLETTDRELQKKITVKCTLKEFRNAVENLMEAGYSRKSIYTYLLAGLPGQTFESVKNSIVDVGEVGVKISLAEFSPIPGTPMSEDLPDPLFTNNSVFFYYRNRDKEMDKLKRLVRWVNRGVDLGFSLSEIKGYL